MVYGTSPSSTGSSAPVTTTDCGTFQSAAVNVRLDVETAPSEGSVEATGITTSAVGWLFRTTSNDVGALTPSLVTRPATGVTVTPAASSSAFETPTSAGSIAA